MELTNIKYKNKLFWIFQIVGWIAFGIFDSYIKYQDDFYDLKGFIARAVTYLSGILVTVVLRKIYNSTKFSTTTILVKSIYIIVYSIPATLIWLVIDNMLSIPIWGFDIITRGIITQPPLQLFTLCFYHYIVMIAWNGLYFGIKNTIEWTWQKEKTEKAELLLEIAQLKVLRYQLDPHFLFNTLSSLRMLIRKDAHRAEQMLNRISEFLRYSITTKDKYEVPFSEELKAINEYIEIEKIRFGEKINFMSIIDPLAEDFPIPIFLIYPLIENAIKYGMDSSGGDLNIELNAKVKNNTLMINVINNGKWQENAGNKTSSGMGLKNIKDRLKHSYPNNHSFTIDKTNGKVVANLELTRNFEKNL